MNFAQAIERATHTLKHTGQIVETKTVHGVEVPAPMYEALNVTLKCEMPDTLELANALIGPNQAWADKHFAERVSRNPMNPPPSHVHWPYAKERNEKFTFDEKFSHTYPERFWPKKAGESASRINNALLQINEGIRYQYGDLDDLIAILNKDLESRQAYLPIWFPEDLNAAAYAGVRVPCSLGYHIIIRKGYLHIVYFIRSCDYFRHFRDDIYMAYRLALWVKSIIDTATNLGTFTMHITSLHCFLPEVNKL